MGEEEQPVVIIGVDPGVTTGIAWWTASTPKGGTPFGTEQVTACDTDGGLRTLLYQVGAWIAEGGYKDNNPQPVHLVVERFEFRHEDQQRTKIDFTAAEVVGALRTLAVDRHNVTFIRQGAAQVKGFWTDDKIQKLALWVPGARHAMDAMRHLLAHRLFTLGHKALLDPFRPSPPVVGRPES